MVRELFPIASLITPNIPEAEILCGIEIMCVDDMIKAAEILSGKTGTAVLVKGRHSISDATDVLFENGQISYFCSERIDNPNTHGTGCTLSSAIACGLADGKTLSESISSA